MKHTFQLALLAAILALSAITLPAYAQTPPAPSITPLTVSVTAGSIIQFSGSGFAGGERVAFWATAPTQAVLGGFFTVAQKDGSIGFEFRAPADAVGGTWAMTAFGIGSQTVAVATFTVIGRDPTDADRAAWSDPVSIPARERIRFAATGFRARERVSYWFTGPDGEVYDAHPAGAVADANGRVDISYIAHEPTGTWVVTFQGLRSGVTRGVPFDVRARN